MYCLRLERSCNVSDSAEVNVLYKSHTVTWNHSRYFVSMMHYAIDVAPYPSWNYSRPCSSAPGCRCPLLVDLITCPHLLALLLVRAVLVCTKSALFMLAEQVKTDRICRSARGALRPCICRTNRTFRTALLNVRSDLKRCTGD